jgi:hypothetical protein
MVAVVEGAVMETVIERCSGLDVGKADLAPDSSRQPLTLGSAHPAGSGVERSGRHSDPRRGA